MNKNYLKSQVVRIKFRKTTKLNKKRTYFEKPSYVFMNCNSFFLMGNINTATVYIYICACVLILT